MNTHTAIAVLIVVLLAGAGMWYYVLNGEEGMIQFDRAQTGDNADMGMSAADVSVTPIEHATAVLEWGGTVIYTDPVGGAAAFADAPAPDLILMTDIHGDHLDAETLGAVLGEDTTLVAPQAVVDELPSALADRAFVLANDETTQQLGFSITGMPMYNLPDQGVEIRHTQGRGNGYVLERDGVRVYIAGDTADTPEMRALTDIDVALVPMNMPYTMSVEDAASGVLAFAPARVYPYHYRGQDGLADVERFRQLVNEGNPAIDVVLLDWYPEQ